MNTANRLQVRLAIAVGYFLVAIPALFGGLIILAIPIPAIITSGVHGLGLLFSMLGLGLAVLATAGVGSLALLAGWGLVAGQSWAPTLAIVLAVLMLPAFPFGTIVGGLALWFLLPQAREDPATRS